MGNKRKADINTDYCNWSLNLVFKDAEQRKYVSKLTSWLVKQRVFEFDYKTDFEVHHEGGCILNISSCWMNNLTFLTDKLDELFPSIEEDD